MAEIVERLDCEEESFGYEYPGFMGLAVPFVRFNWLWKYIEEAQEYYHQTSAKLARSYGHYYLSDAQNERREYQKKCFENGELKGEVGYLKKKLKSKKKEVDKLKAVVNDLRHQLEHNAIRDVEGAKPTGSVMAAAINGEQKKRIAYYLNDYGLDKKEIADLLSVGEKSIYTYLKDAKAEVHEMTVNGTSFVEWSRPLK